MKRRLIFGLVIFLCACSKWGCGSGSTATQASGYNLTAIWANDGGDKVTQDELRASNGDNVINGVWDGTTVKQFGAKNEIVSVNLILESGSKDSSNLSVSLMQLSGSGGTIATQIVAKDNVFNYVGRNIEIFHVRYLQIKGVSRIHYNPTYDERHVPEKLQMPWHYVGSKAIYDTGMGWVNRPNHDKYYPDIAVPMEAVNTFSISKGNNQSIWIDIYIPKNTTAGTYSGTIDIYSSDVKTRSIPIQLEVLNFTLPDASSAKTMVYWSESNVNFRYTGIRWDDSGGVTPAIQATMRNIFWNHHKVAHRHKISLINDGVYEPLNYIAHWKWQRWIPVFNGSLFTADNNYSGPGDNTANGIYSIGTYGGWRYWTDWATGGIRAIDNQDMMNSKTNAWVDFMETNFPTTEYFLYTMDEPTSGSYADIEKWAGWVKANPGSGKRLKTLVTKDIITKANSMPSVDIGFVAWGDNAVWSPFITSWLGADNSYWVYNGTRPMNGSFAIEDEGVALRVNAWSQYKHKSKRAFFWESTYYKNGTTTETNVFTTAHTFGSYSSDHFRYGQTGSNYGNGDGVLFYPGTETLYTSDNYGILGPIASLRLKLWRRGLQDVDYLTLAAAKDNAAVQAIVQRMIPRTEWEVGVYDPADPTYVHTGISWSVDPDVWERARRDLANIIMR